MGNNSSNDEDIEYKNALANFTYIMGIRAEIMELALKYLAFLKLYEDGTNESGLNIYSYGKQLENELNVLETKFNKSFDEINSSLSLCNTKQISTIKELILKLKSKNDNTMILLRNIFENPFY